MRHLWQSAWRGACDVRGRHSLPQHDAAPAAPAPGAPRRSGRGPSRAGPPPEARAGAAGRLRRQHQLRHVAAGAGAGLAKPAHPPGHKPAQRGAFGGSTRRATSQRVRAPARPSRPTARATSWRNAARCLQRQHQVNGVKARLAWLHRSW